MGVYQDQMQAQALNSQRALLQAQQALAAQQQGGSGGAGSQFTTVSPSFGGGTTAGDTTGGSIGPGAFVSGTAPTGGGGAPLVSPAGLPAVSPPAFVNPGQTIGQNVTSAVGGQQSTNVSRAANFSQSYIPEYSQTPILEAIAKQAQSMAPQVYQWGMDQFSKQQGNIDALMRNALSYASPQRIAANMGMAESGVMQSAEAGRQSALRDLQSFGIDPSSGRYAALDNASRVQAGAAAAGAGNQQRISDQAAGTAMQNQAIAAAGQNIQTGYGAAGAANQLLGTASQLKYDPLGTASGGYSTGDAQSTGYNVSSGSGYNESQAFPPNIPDPGAGSTNSLVQWGNQSGTNPAAVHVVAGKAAGGPITHDDDATTGGFVSQDLSPSNGSQTDDVQANLNAGEFVIPRDVAAWKGQEFFYKLMAQARKTRATAGNGDQPQVGYGGA